MEVMEVIDVVVEIKMMEVMVMYFGQLDGDSGDHYT